MNKVIRVCKITKLCIITTLFFAFFYAMLLHLNIFSKENNIYHATEKIMAAHKIPSCAVVEYQNSKLSYDNYGKSYGADVNDSSLFVLGSTTKAFTGLAIQMITDEGYLDLDDNISDYIPWLHFIYKGEKTEITIRQLLSHSSGIPYKTLFHLPKGDFDGVIEKSVKEINGIELDFTPGSQYQYVNMNYTLLAYLLEVITGMNYEAYIQNTILLPLGMNNTYLYLEQAIQKDSLMSGSRSFFGSIIKYNIELDGANKPAGGLITCTNDLGKWIKAQMGESNVPDNLRIAIARTHDIRQCAYTPKEGEDYYLFGWHISADGKTITHTGGIQNYGSCVIIDLRDRTAVAALCNSMLSPAVYIAQNYMAALQGNNNFNIRFVSVATLDIICSFFCLLLLFFIIHTVIKRIQRKSCLEKTSSLIMKNVLLCCIFTVLACLPNLFGYTYRMLWGWSALTMIVLMIEGMFLCGLKIYYNSMLLWKQTHR